MSAGVLDYPVRTHDRENELMDHSIALRSSIVMQSAKPRDPWYLGLPQVLFKRGGDIH